MKELNKENLIKYGIYSGMKLGKVINMYGREVILEILKNNLVSEEVIKECGYHKVSPKEKQEREKKETPIQDELVQECDVSQPDKETYEEDMYSYWEEDYENSIWDNPIDYEPDDNEFSPWFKYKPWIYGE